MAIHGVGLATEKKHERRRCRVPGTLNKADSRRAQRKEKGGKRAGHRYSRKGLEEESGKLYRKSRCRGGPWITGGMHCSSQSRRREKRNRHLLIMKRGPEKEGGVFGGAEIFFLTLPGGRLLAQRGGKELLK